MVRFYEEVRVYMAKFDAEERRASGRPIPEEIQRLLGDVIAANTVSGEVIDIYEAAGMLRPQLSDLTPEFLARAQQSSNAHLAIEALRNTVLQESARVTRNNLVRERAFSERVAELVNATKAFMKLLGFRAAHQRGSQLVPIVGIVFNAGTNAAAVTLLSERAQAAYRLRFLGEKYDLDPATWLTKLQVSVTDPDGESIDVEALIDEAEKDRGRDNSQG